MLKQSVTLNFSIIAEQGKKLKYTYYFTLCTMLLMVCAFWWENMLGSSIAGIVGMVISVVMVIGIFQRIFHQSLFSEDAYTYMTFPISEDAVIKGKLLTGVYWLMWNSMFMTSIGCFLYLWWRDQDYGVTYWDIDVADAITDDLNQVAQIIFNCRISSVAIVFLIATAVVHLFIMCVLVCSEVQLAAILNHMYNPNGRKPYVKFILAFAGVLIFAGCLFLPTWIWSVCTEEMITMLPVVITMVIEVVLSLCFVRLSRRGLEQKYELY